MNDDGRTVVDRAVVRALHNVQAVDDVLRHDGGRSRSALRLRPYNGSLQYVPLTLL